MYDVACEFACAVRMRRNNYNIASRAGQSTSVYVRELKIPIVHADNVSKSLHQKFFSVRATIVSAGKILYFTTIMDTNRDSPTSP